MAAATKAAGMPRLDQQLLGFRLIVNRRRRLPVEIVARRNDAVRELRVTQGQSLVDRLAVEGEIGRLTHPLVVPRRLRVPLIGEVEPEGCRRVPRLEGEPR